VSCRRAPGNVWKVHHPDQLWWPELGLRKRDALEYYAELAPVVLPHLRNRPFTIKQHYNGPESPSRWLKDKPSDAPKWVSTTAQPAKSRRGAVVQYVVVRDARTLLWLVDYGAVDLHVWTSRTDKPDRPDIVLLDLDPREAPFGAVVEAALLLREALDGLGFEAVPMTTGGDGMHVRVPIVRRHGYAEVRAFARVMAETLRRVGVRRVTLDVKMNGHGQQIVAPYSIRPVATAAVATPLHWSEVGDALDPAAFTPPVVRARVGRDGDVAAPLLHSRQRLAGIL
jgi:bifunctional non-homologous end joining protein LigD